MTGGSRFREFSFPDALTTRDTDRKLQPDLTGAVPARASVITLGARDIDALKAFYNGLGWKLAVDLDGFAAFELRGAVLALFPLDELALDANAPAASSEHGLRGFTISINVDQREQVDETIAAVSEA